MIFIRNLATEFQLSILDLAWEDDVIWNEAIGFKLCNATANFNLFQRYRERNQNWESFWSNQGIQLNINFWDPLAAKNKGIADIGYCQIV